MCMTQAEGQNCRVTGRGHGLSKPAFQRNEKFKCNTSSRIGTEAATDLGSSTVAVTCTIPASSSPARCSATALGRYPKMACLAASTTWIALLSLELSGCLTSETCVCLVQLMFDLKRLPTMLVWMCTQAGSNGIGDCSLAVSDSAAVLALALWPGTGVVLEQLPWLLW